MEIQNIMQIGQHDDKLNYNQGKDRKKDDER